MKLRLRSLRGQVSVLAVVLVFLFIMVATALVDIYHIEEARLWGYRVAQQSSMAGVSRGRYWEGLLATPDPSVPTPAVGECVDSPPLSLSNASAYSNAEGEVIRSMSDRGIAGYSYDIRVLPYPNGGSVANYPPRDVRIGYSTDWQADRPAVGVYLTFPVNTFLLSFVGQSQVTLHVFAAAEVVYPAPCPP